MASSEQTHTTLTGQPIPAPTYDNHTSIMYGDGAAGFGADNAAGANLLPPGYTPNSLVRIPVKLADYDDLAAEKKPEKKGLFNKLKGIAKDKSGGDFTVVGMRQGDYVKYWAKGEDGQFLPTVVEPPEGRAEWVRKQLLENEEWKRDGVM